jgi:hypothetical protein
MYMYIVPTQVITVTHDVTIICMKKILLIKVISRNYYFYGELVTHNPFFIGH